MGEVDGNSIQTTGKTDKWIGQSCDGWGGWEFYTGKQETLTSEQGRAVMGEVDGNSIQDNRQHWQVNRAELWWVRWVGILYRQQVTLKSEQGRAVMGEMDGNSIQTTGNTDKWTGQSCDGWDGREFFTDNRQHWQVNRAELWWMRWTGILYRTTGNTDKWTGQSCDGWDGREFYTGQKVTLTSEQGRAVMGEMDGNSIQENRKHWQVNRAELSWVRWMGILYRTTGNTDKWIGQSCDGWGGWEFYTDNR